MKHNHKQDDIMKEIRSLPEPDYESTFDPKTKNQIKQNLHRYSFVYEQKQKKRTTRKRIAVGFIGFATLVFFLLFTLSSNLDNKLSSDQSIDTSNTSYIIEFIKQELELQSSKRQIRNLFGEPSGITKANSLDGLPHNAEQWRYDFSNEGYSFDESNSVIDYEGFQEDDMNVQLMITWSSNFFRKVSRYSIYYKDEDLILNEQVTDEGTKQYYITPDGKVHDIDKADDFHYDHVEIMEADTNSTITIAEMEKFLLDQDLAIETKKSEDNPTLNGVEAHLYSLNIGNLFIHVYNNAGEAIESLNQLELVYESKQSIRKVNRTSNIVLVYEYEPLYSTIYRTNENKRKLNQVTDEILVSSENE